MAALQSQPVLRYALLIAAVLSGAIGAALLVQSGTDETEEVVFAAGLIALGAAHCGAALTWQRPQRPRMLAALAILDLALVVLVLYAWTQISN